MGEASTLRAMKKPWEVLAANVWLFGFLLIPVGLLLAAIGGMNGISGLAQAGGWVAIAGALVLLIGIVCRIGRRSYERAR